MIEDDDAREEGISNTMLVSIKAFSITLLAVFGIAFIAGYKSAPRELLDTDVQHVGFMVIDTQRVLSATVESLKSESRLVSYSFVGTQNVSIERKYWYVFSGNQQLIVPSTVSYFVDLSKLSASSATYDVATKTVTVTLPKLMLTVEFDPRRATYINNGIPTMNGSVVQALTKLNFDKARQSATKQGQQSELVRLAKDRTRENMVRLFELPLRVAGISDVKIKVLFPGEPA